MNNRRVIIYIKHYGVCQVGYMKCFRDIEHSLVRCFLVATPTLLLLCSCQRNPVHEKALEIEINRFAYEHSLAAYNISSVIGFSSVPGTPAFTAVTVDYSWRRLGCDGDRDGKPLN